MEGKGGRKSAREDRWNGNKIIPIIIMGGREKVQSEGQPESRTRLDLFFNFPVLFVSAVCDLILSFYEFFCLFFFFSEGSSFLIKPPPLGRPSGTSNTSSITRPRPQWRQLSSSPQMKPAAVALVQAGLDVFDTAISSRLIV